MTESSKSLSGSSKEQFEEYMEMSDNSKGVRRADQEPAIEEYMEMTGKEQDSNKNQEGGSMYVDLETVQDYEVPVNCKKPSSSDLTYL